MKFLCVLFLACYQTLFCFASLPVTTQLIGNEPLKTNSPQKTQLLLYYTSWCPYSQKVLNYLKQIQKTVPMKNLDNDSKAREELKKIGGKAQVPCLVIDQKALYESDAIIKLGFKNLTQHLHREAVLRRYN